MLKNIIFIVMIFHGLIHMIGVAKAFNFAKLPQIANEISKFDGLIWLKATLLIILSAFLFVYSYQYWWIVGLVSILISQYLVFTVWNEAKYATIINVIILITIGFSIGVLKF